MSEDFLTADERREVLREYGQDFYLDVFIETGTNDGGTPLYLKDDFKELHTIELGSRQYRAAVKTFAPYPWVHCHQGDSAKVLAAVLKKVEEPALIWLDGHYSGPGTAQGSKNCPAMEEIQAIIDDGRPHVVLVDDARCFYGGKHNPVGGTPMYDHYSTWESLENVQKLAEGAGFKFLVKDDIIRLTP